jgi:hypothetical protein
MGHESVIETDLNRNLGTNLQIGTGHCDIHKHSELAQFILEPLSFQVARYVSCGRQQLLNLRVLDLSCDQEYLKSVLGSPKKAGDIATVYNPGPSITDNEGNAIFYARAEYFSDFRSATVVPWKRNKSGIISPIAGLIFKGEDPYLTKIDGQTVLTYTKVFNRNYIAPDAIGWGTAVKSGNTLNDLEDLCFIPDMKDVRFKQLNISKVKKGFTRPQARGGPPCEDCGPGQVGSFNFNDLTDLKNMDFRSHELLFRFAPGEWGGIGPMEELPNGKVLVGYHHAMSLNRGERLYTTCLGGYDPYKDAFVSFGVWGLSSDYQKVPAKNNYLSNVVFIGDIEANVKEGTIRITEGINDYTCGERIVGMSPQIKEFVG